MVAAKKAAPEQSEPLKVKIRCIARVWVKDSKGKPKLWAVYDRERGSWPLAVPGFGELSREYQTEEEAQTDATRLDDFYRQSKPQSKPKKTAKSKDLTDGDEG